MFSMPACLIFAGMNSPVALFWFRRDLRLEDNAGLYEALRCRLPVLPVFIFDDHILDELDRDDARVTFLHASLASLSRQLAIHGSTLVVRHGDPVDCWKELLEDYKVGRVFANHDYEPYARQRDQKVESLLNAKGIPFETHRDQVIFERDDVVKDDGTPYTVYTPYMRKWFTRFERETTRPFPSEKNLANLAPCGPEPMPSLEQLGFHESSINVPAYDTGDGLVENYRKTRDLPYLDGTSRIGPYLRFGLVGIRDLVSRVRDHEPTFVKELVWRGFFMQILWHFPRGVDTSFREQYDRVGWFNDESHFKRWCEGSTGYPIVDAGMRELKETGYMHNRVRMVTASFLCKHLPTDWAWGEAWLARHLLDYELSSNNGNWQWAAGTGCDAAPYFRVFNPATQQQKFDPDLRYVRRWVPEYGTGDYPAPVVDHKSARERAIAAYKRALG